MPTISGYTNGLSVPGFGLEFSVGEPDMIEFDAAVANCLDGMRGRDDFYWGVEQLEDAFARSHRRLQNVVFVTEVLNGTEEPLRVLHEGDENADRDGPGNHTDSAKPEDQCDGDGRENFDYRVIDGVGHDGVFVGVHVLRVDFLEFLVRPLFAVEKLQNNNARNMFLQVGVDAGNRNANAEIGIPHRPGEQRSGPEDSRQDGEGDQRQPPLHPQHDHDDAQKDKYVFENRT